ncbi:unnamed protein product [Rhodiola kirilowii]
MERFPGQLFYEASSNSLKDALGHGRRIHKMKTVGI